MRSLLALLALVACSALVCGESEFEKLKYEFEEEAVKKETELVQSIESEIESLTSINETVVEKIEAEFKSLYESAVADVSSFNLTVECLANSTESFQSAVNSTKKCLSATEDLGELIVQLDEHAVKVASDISSLIADVSECVAETSIGDVICTVEKIYKAYSTLLNLSKETKVLIAEASELGTTVSAQVDTCFHNGTVSLIEKAVENAQSCIA